MRCCVYGSGLLRVGMGKLPSLGDDDAHVGVVLYSGRTT